MISTCDLPDTLYCAGQVREIDNIVIYEHGFDGFSPMNKAAKFSYR